MYHWLLLIPILALIFFLLLPWPIAGPLFLVTLAGTIVAYWKAIQAQRRPVATGENTMIGDRATVVEAEKETLTVMYQGDTWNAVSEQRLRRGQTVIIEKVEGLTLHVKPLSQDHPAK